MSKRKKGTTLGDMYVAGMGQTNYQVLGYRESQGLW